MPEMTVAELLRELVDTQASGSVRKLAAYLSVSPTALDRWVKGLSQPDPPYCWKIAERAKLPVCDVMRMAGHLPPSEEPTKEPEISFELRAALSGMSLDEQRRFALPAIELAQTLIREARAKEG